MSTQAGVEVTIYTPNENSGVSRRRLDIYPTTPPGLPHQTSEHSQNLGVDDRISQGESQVDDYGDGVRQYLEQRQGRGIHDDDFCALGSGVNDSWPKGSDGTAKSDFDSDLDRMQGPHETLESVESSKPLKEMLWNALRPDMHSNKESFLPRGDLERICHFDAVFKEVLPFCKDEGKAADCAEFVCGSREAPSSSNKDSSREIFAILVLIKAVWLMPKFQEEEIRDCHLPFGCSRHQMKLWPRKSDESNHLRILDGKENEELRREFYRRQWWVHIPFFARDPRKPIGGKALEYQFEEGTILPWTDISHETKSGGFGDIQKIEIHPDHHAFKEHKSFALKTLNANHSHSQNKAIFTQELEAFRKMGLGPHLIELCATLTVGTKLMLLFPWAEGGTLQTLWTQNPPTLEDCSREDTSIFIEWVARQCHGLAVALHGIHGFFDKIDEADPRLKLSPIWGIHGDIKPENILYFSQDTTNHRRGCLKMADFGLLTFHRKSSRTRFSMETAQAAYQTYRSPEHDIKQIISRKIDMWALGCVFSEMLTWVIRGPEAIHNYTAQRALERSYSGNVRNRAPWNEDTFFVKHIERRRLMRLLETMGVVKVEEALVPKLKNNVSQWLKELYDEVDLGSEEKTFLQDFLIFTKDRMLNPDRMARSDCEEVKDFLKDCLEKGKDNKAYWEFKLPKENGMNGATGVQSNRSILTMNEPKPESIDPGHCLGMLRWLHRGASRSKTA